MQTEPIGMRVRAAGIERGAAGRRRSAASKMVWRTMVMAGLLFIPACASDHIRDIEDQQSDLLRRMQRAIALCEGEPQCIAETRAYYQKLNRDLEDLRLQIMRENWQDARKLRDALIKYLQSIIDKFPELQKLLDKLLEDQRKDKEGTGDGKVDATPKPIGNGNPSGTGSDKPGGAGANQLLAPVVTYDFHGYFNFDQGEYKGHYDLSGSLALMVSDTATGSGTFTSGNVVVTVLGVPLKFPINTSYKFPSTLTLNSSGSGTAYLVLGMDPIMAISDEMAASVNPITAISIPVSRDALGALHFNFPHGQLRQLFPYDPWVASDYNKDGVLDFNADYQAFLVAWAAQEIMADINLDGLWNQTDLQLWTAHFQEDWENQ